MTMTRDEVFHKAASHMLRQNARSETTLSGCAYRGSYGMMCAAGVLIVEERYVRRMEGKSADHELVWDALVASGVPDDEQTKSMVCDLQTLHDQEEPADWLSLLKQRARDYGISWKGDA